jgi:hypothetical protein
MGRAWCADLPVVSVAHGVVGKPVTFIVPFYENPSFLQRQIGWWRTYPAELRRHLSAIIVDDGSPTPAMLPDDRPFPLRLFRVDVDVRWNWLAARNIGFQHASEGWCLVTDIDHVIPESTASSVVYGSHDSGGIYGFSRIEHTGEPLASHPNSWLLTRSMFWKVGGYDETLSGHYGTDGDWRRRCVATAPMRILTDRLIRHEYDGDSSTTRYLRKQPEDAAVKRLVAARGRSWQPKTLSFPYHEVVEVAV